MKKLLLIAYYFQPLNAVAGTRAWSWATDFIKHGIHPTVITRHWKGNESRWSDLTEDVDAETTFEQNSAFDIYRLSSRKTKAVELLTGNLLQFNLFSKAFYLVLNSLGYLNAESDARASFRKFLFTHLKDHTYDYVIVTSPPLNIIRLAAEINRKFNIPVHVDFRDLWNNGYLNSSYKPPFNLRLIDKFKRIYIKRWLRRAHSVSAVSKPIAGIINYVYSREVFVVTNGFDATHYNNAIKHSSPKFRFSLVGTYYPQQTFNILIEGMKRFLVDKSPGEFVINLIGVSVHSSVMEHLVASLPQQFLHIEDRLSSDRAAEFVINSEVLFQAAWKGFRGIYTTKLFDFIASGNNVLLAPGDDDVMDDLIDRTHTGRIANNVDEFVNLLNAWFKEWKEKGSIAYNGQKEEVRKYSRQYIAADFARRLNEIYRQG